MFGQKPATQTTGTFGQVSSNKPDQNNPLSRTTTPLFGGNLKVTPNAPLFAASKPSDNQSVSGVLQTA